MIKYKCQAVSIVFLLLFSCYCNAQIEVSAGIELGYPEVITGNNKLITAGQISSGVRATVTYRADWAAFFPALNLSYGGTRLPLQQNGNNVAALNFRYINVMLDENYAVSACKGQLTLYGGIGLYYLAKKSVAASGMQTIQTTIDSTANITKVFPAVNIGAAYDFGQAESRNFYVTVGVNFQYVLLLSGRNNYYVTVAEPGNKFYSYQSALSGNLVSPGFYVTLHYKLRKRNSGMYL